VVHIPLSTPCGKCALRRTHRAERESWTPKKINQKSRSNYNTTNFYNIASVYNSVHGPCESGKNKRNISTLYAISGSTYLGPIPSQP